MPQTLLSQTPTWPGAETLLMPNAKKKKKKEILDPTTGLPIEEADQIQNPPVTGITTLGGEPTAIKNRPGFLSTMLDSFQTAYGVGRNKTILGG